MDIRPLTDADLSAVACRLAAEFPNHGFSQANLRGKLQGDPDHDPALNLCAWTGERLDAVLLGVVRGERAYVKALTVWPHESASEALLARFEALARERGASELHATGSAPSYFLPGIDATDTLTFEFYRRHGFEKVRESFNMSCDLTRLPTDTAADEARLAGAGYRIARLRPADEAPFRAFVERCFSPGWATESLLALDNVPIAVHLAWHADAIVAFAAAEVTNPGWFGPMGTDPAHRQHGLGRVLLLRCLADLRNSGYREAQIGWVGPLGFYAKHCQARVSRVFWMVRKGLG